MECCVLLCFSVYEIVFLDVLIISWLYVCGVLCCTQSVSCAGRSFVPPQGKINHTSFVVMNLITMTHTHTHKHTQRERHTRATKRIWNKVLCSYQLAGGLKAQSACTACGYVTTRRIDFCCRGQSLSVHTYTGSASQDRSILFYNLFLLFVWYCDTETEFLLDQEQHWWENNNY